MAINTYVVKSYLATGVQGAPETIAFADLTNISGEALPTTFSAAPMVAPNSLQDREGNVVTGSVTVTQFQFAMSVWTGNMNLTEFYFDFVIIGEPA